MPAKLIPSSWQLKHDTPATAACFMDPPEKLVKLEGMWQVSHAAAPTGMCAGAPVAIVVMARPPALYLGAFVGLWQSAQLVVMPVWPVTPMTYIAKLPAVVWHSVQACVVGIWLFGLVPLVTLLANVGVVLWQLAQSPPEASVGWTLSSVALGRESPAVVFELATI